MSHATDRPAYEALTVPERIELLQDLWDEIAAAPEQLEITLAQREELDARLEDYRRDPDSGITWEAVRASLRRTDLSSSGSRRNPR